MIKTELPVIILRGIILLPNNDIRLEFDNDISKNIIDVAELFHDSKVLIISKEDPLEESVDLKELPKIGVVARISHKMELPNGKTRLVISGLKRANVVELLNNDKNEDILEAIIEEIVPEEIDAYQEQALIKKLQRELEYYTKTIPYASNSIISIVKNMTSLDKMTDVIVPYLNIESDRVLTYLYELNPVERLTYILEDIYDETEMYQIEKEIDSRVKREMDDTQRKYILKEKLNEIKKQLGDTSVKENEINKINKKLETLNLNDKIKTRIDEELNRFETLNETSPEVNIVRNYIEWLLNIPWNVYTKDNDDLNDIANKLDKTHSGLKEVKDRIIEYIAVRKKSNNLKTPILCLVGPPGVGKTSFVSSIASAIDRNFVKISVGGMNDEAEIIGHRRTYLGANPGRIIQSLKKAKSMNPVFLIDEIDKMTKDQKGDPASTLLEVLDPEQNEFFSDNYIEEEVDLSKIMFITTANNIEDIPEPLRDRLEIIEMTGYTEYEKLEIVKNYLLPKICDEHGLDYKNITFEDKLILDVIREYTKESGVRNLERTISKIMRKIVTELLKKKIAINKITIDKKMIDKYLGKPLYEKELDNNSEIGVVNGLAYTPYGGDVLKIEVNYFKGKGNLLLTGSIGEVMEESAKIALDYVKSNYKEFGIDYKKFDNDIHIHVPEGAVKKDGPSAGIALTTALISSLTNSRVDSSIAMTGEITLRGNILKIGGLKEKSIGALRNGIKTILIPKGNINDLEKLPDQVKENIKFIPVSTYSEALDVLKEEVKNRE